MEQIKEGYKKTEVGAIPEDWKVKAIREVCKIINGRGFKPHEWKQEGLPIIRIQNLNGSQDFNYYQGHYDPKIEVENNQLLFAWSGSRGTSFGPHVWKGSKGLLNYHTWKVNIFENEVERKFFLHALKQLTKFIEDKAHGASALVHTQKWEMEGFEFPLPPTLEEQKAIATALSDVDALIQSLDKLIAKKKAIKQGSMQRLLKSPAEGGHRLPGFSGEWEVKKLGECLTKNPEYGINAAAVDYNENLPVYIRITDITEDGRFSPDKKASVDKVGSENFLLREGDIVLARTGASTGKSYLYNKVDGELVFAGFLIRISPNPKFYDSRFIKSLLT